MSTRSNGHGPIDFSALATALLRRARVLLPQWFQNGRFQGKEFIVGSLAGEAGSSLSINAETGIWKDFSADDVKGGDLVSLYAAREDIKQGEAAKRLAQEIGFELSPNSASRRSTMGKISKPEPHIVKPPACTAPPSMQHSRHGVASSSWRYSDAAGEALFYVARYETPGGKVFCPWSWDENSARWIANGWPAPRPLYGLDLLAKRPDADALIVEGEKAVEAARIIAGNVYVVVTWPNGAEAVEKANWKPLAGRKILIWPDADSSQVYKTGHEKAGQVKPYEEQPGPSAASEIAAILALICPEVKVLDVRGQPDGWDSADALSEGWEWQRFSKWVASCTKIFTQTPLDCDGATDAIRSESSVAGKGEWEAPVPFESFGLPIFPTAVLPDWLRRFVEGESVATQTPPDLSAMLSLAVLAVACAKKVAVLVRAGWVEAINIFVAVAMLPGNRKSRVFSDVEEPIQSFEAEAVRNAEEPIAEAENRYKILQGQLQHKQNKAAQAKNEADATTLTQGAAAITKELAAFHVPARLRLIVDDVTPERLATLLQVQGGRMAVLSAEGGIFDMMAGRYSRDGSANFEVFLKGHAGDTLRVDRVGRPPEYVPHPALTLGLAVQPSVLAGLAGKAGFRGRGLLGRFAYSLPVNNLGRRLIEPPPLAQEVRDTFKRNLQALLALPFSEDEQGKARTEFLRLSHEAAKRVTKFQAWVEPQLADHGDLGTITDWAGKLVGLVARIAGLLHMAKHSGNVEPWKTPITRETVEAAIRVGEYLIPHARAAYACMGADPAVEQAKYVLSWVRRQGLASFSKRDVFNGLRGRFRKVADLDPALSALVDRNYIRPMVAEPRPGPGRKPSQEFEVNPAALESKSAYCADSAEGSGTSNAGEEPLIIDGEVSVNGSSSQADRATHNPQNTQNSESEPSPVFFTEILDRDPKLAAEVKRMVGGKGDQE